MFIIITNLKLYLIMPVSSCRDYDVQGHKCIVALYDLIFNVILHFFVVNEYFEINYNF